ncbi:MAG: cytochrome c [Isosphaeraceae bacterium]
METRDPSPTDDKPFESSNPAARWIFLGMLGLLLVGALTFGLLRKPPPPPSAAVMKDPLLMEGRTIYLARCATCHGMEGRGDGPIAPHLLGPPVGNISDGKWKHGDRPGDVYRVIAKGVEGTRMAGWEAVLEPAQLRAVSAYTFHLAGRDVPAEFRDPSP